LFAAPNLNLFLESDARLKAMTLHRARNQLAVLLIMRHSMGARLTKRMSPLSKLIIWGEFI
jgi:hypothetical protein